MKYKLNDKVKIQDKHTGRIQWVDEEDTSLPYLVKFGKSGKQFWFTESALELIIPENTPETTHKGEENV